MDSPTMSFSLAPVTSATWIEEAALSGAVSLGRASGARSLADAEDRLLRGLDRIEKQFGMLSSVLGLGPGAPPLAPLPALRTALTTARVIRSELLILSDDARTASEVQVGDGVPAARQARVALLVEDLARTNEALGGLVLELDAGRLAGDHPTALEHFLTAARDEGRAVAAAFGRGAARFRSACEEAAAGH